MIRQDIPATVDAFLAGLAESQGIRAGQRWPSKLRLRNPTSGPAVRSSAAERSLPDPASAGRSRRPRIGAIPEDRGLASPFGGRRFDDVHIKN